MTESKNTLVFVVGFIVLVGIVVLQGQRSNNDRVNEFVVSGSAKLDVAPDEAQVFLRIETTAASPKDAQDRNSHIADTVINSLKSAGFADVETTGYRVEILREWDRKLEKTVDKGYRAWHTLKVTTKMLDKVGFIAEISINNGVQGVDNIFFTLSKEKEKEVKSEALSRAARNAQEKADALAESLGVRRGKAVHVSESLYEVGPVFARAEMIEQVAPQIEPSDVTVQAQVSVSFGIE